MALTLHSMPRFRLERQLAGSMLVAGLMLAAAVGASYFIKVSAERVEELGAASLVRSAELDRALLSLLLAESHQRALLITGRASELAPYESARSLAHAAFTRLRYLYAEEPAMLRRVEELGAQVQARLDQLDAGLEAYRARGAEGAKAAVEAEADAGPTPRIRHLLAELKDREEETQERLARLVDERRNTLLWLEVALLAALLLGGALLCRGLLRQARERHLLAEQLERAALHDPLTQLPNRRHFADELERSLARAARRGEQRAVLFVDLDGFKRINDELGHQRGDELLQQVAQRFTQLARKGDFVARLGGDEFAVLIEDAGPEAGRCLALRLIEALAQPLLPAHPAHRVGASVGIARFPEDAEDPAGLLSRADDAMYAAKRAGKGRVHAYSPPP